MHISSSIIIFMFGKRELYDYQTLYCQKNTKKLKIKY